MPTLKVTDAAKQLEEQKVRLEAKFKPRVFNLFENLAEDAEALYLSSDIISADNLAENYKTEFVALLRSIYRETISKFGFSIRKSLNQKSLAFTYEKKADISDDDLNEKEKDINKRFAELSAFFVANNSEKQSSYITNTNKKEIERALLKAEDAFAMQRAEIANQLESLRLESAAQSLISAKEQQIRQLDDVRQEIVGKNLKTNLLLSFEERSKLISAQEVGLAESWSRNKEAELINNANLVTSTAAIVRVNKEWATLLDDKTRESHVVADGQIKQINEMYEVGGELLEYPRDPRGSASNVINCRCLSIHKITTI